MVPAAKVPAPEAGMRALSVIAAVDRHDTEPMPDINGLGSDASSRRAWRSKAVSVTHLSEGMERSEDSMIYSDVWKRCAAQSGAGEPT